MPWHPHGGSLSLPVSTGNHSCTLPVKAPSRLSSSPPRRGTSPLREHQCLVTPVATPRVLDGIGACGSLGTPTGRSLNAPQQDMATLKAVRGEVELGLTPLRQELHELCDSMVTRMEAVESLVARLDQSLALRIDALEERFAQHGPPAKEAVQNVHQAMATKPATRQTSRSEREHIRHS